MYVLDSDSINLYLHHKGQQPHLERRIDSTSSKHLWISVITIEEAVQGAFKLINCNKNDPKHHDKILFGYRLLAELIPDLSRFQIVPFDETANSIYQNMPPAVKRIGANDCKIAACALARGFTVVTRNIKDFQAIGVPCRDWTLGEAIEKERE